MNSESDCPICCEKFTTKIRKKFKCHSCNQTCCSKCIISNILNNFTAKSTFGPYGLTKITCLFCKEPVIIYELRDFLPKTVYKKIIKKELEELFNEEFTLLSDTEKFIEEQRIIHEITMIRHWMTSDGFTEDIISNTLQDMGYIIEKKDDKISQTICSCPKCNNLIYDFKCSNCNLQLCNKCLVTISYPHSTDQTLQHKCDPLLVETLKKVTETCHSCPNCKLLIEKEDGGCDQMFCIKCHTTFSWTTGKIALTNVVKHNPHFFEWKRQNNIEERLPNDNPCEGPFLMKCDELEHGTFLKIVHDVLQNSIEGFEEIYERDDLIREQYRIKFLTKKLTIVQWKNKFKQHINTQRRNKETKILLELCIHCLYYIILSSENNNLSEELLKLEEVDFKLTNTAELDDLSQKTIEKMIESLFYFVTENMQKIQIHYGRTIHYIMAPTNNIGPNIMFRI
jgi:hypothetical protein